MTYYIRYIPAEYVRYGPICEPWKIDCENGIATRFGIFPPQVFSANSGECIWDDLRQRGFFLPDGNNPFHKMTLEAGQYYRRISRPRVCEPDEFPGEDPVTLGNTDYIAASTGRLTVLVRQLDRICQVVHPTEKTLVAFGHDIRNLLILACIEVETHWRGVLICNNFKRKGGTADRFTTKDYVLLQRAMRLSGYELKFHRYPWLRSIAPFSGWRCSKTPTQDLVWYHAYNAAKHNQACGFTGATLKHAFDAVGSCAIMIVAQFGLSQLGRLYPELGSFFYFSCVPEWQLSERYMSSWGEQEQPWSPVNFNFSDVSKC